MTTGYADLVGNLSEIWFAEHWKLVRPVRNFKPPPPYGRVCVCGYARASSRVRVRSSEHAHMYIYCSARNETKRSLGGRMCHSAPVWCRGQRASVLRERRSRSMALTPWWCAPSTDESVPVSPRSQESGEWWWRLANANARTKQKKRLPYCVVCSFESHTVISMRLNEAWET